MMYHLKKRDRTDQAARGVVTSVDKFQGVKTAKNCVSLLKRIRV